MTIDTDARTCFTASAEYPQGWVIHPVTGLRLRLLQPADWHVGYGQKYEHFCAAASAPDGTMYRVLWYITPAWQAECDRIETLQAVESLTGAERAELEYLCMRHSSNDQSAACDWDNYEVEDC